MHAICLERECTDGARIVLLLRIAVLLIGILLHSRVHVPG